MSTALPHSNDFSFCPMLGAEAHSLGARSLKDSKRHCMEQLFITGFGNDRNNVVIAEKVRLTSNVRGSHKHPLPIKQDATQHPAPFAPLAAGGESEWCNIFADKIKLNERLTVDFSGFRESPLRQLAERTRA